MANSVKKVVLAYSGGLDTSVMVQWLKDQYGCEVVAYTADVGQGAELTGLREKALKSGCSEIFIEDLKEEFARDFVFTALKASALYEGTYLLGTSIARPLISKRQIEIAREVGADAVCHGATGKGNDQVRFELGYYALMPEVKVIAPWRHWEFKGRQDLMEYADAHGIEVTATKEKPYSMDANLMHISYEGGILEDPWAPPPSDMFVMSKSPEEAPDQPTEIDISFESGMPVAVNGEALSPANLIQALNTLGGDNGIGRIDIVENRFVGMKSRGVYETPGLTILHQAHRALETITLDREVMRLRDSLGTKIADLIYNGFWFSPEFQSLKTMIDDMQKPVTGTVKMKLYKGNSIVLGRKSPHSLYSEELASFEAEEVYNQADAEGFIKLNALRLRMNSGFFNKDFT